MNGAFIGDSPQKIGSALNPINPIIDQSMAPQDGYELSAGSSEPSLDSGEWSETDGHEEKADREKGGLAILISGESAF